jgi:peptidoglycan-associated lipoprotein
MKQTVFVKLFTLLIIVGIGAIGCKHKPGTVTPVPSPKAGKTTGAGTFGPEDAKPLPADTTDVVNSNPAAAGSERTKEGVPLSGTWDPSTSDQDRATLASDTVYFDFDSSAIKSSEKPKIEAVASYLNANSNVGLLIEGNCDERGTEQYNLSLGERRALAVREYLVNLGISSQRVHTLSFGESRPVEPGHNDAAWAKNRRDDFVVLKPKQ